MSNKKKKKIKLNFMLLILAVLSFILYYAYNFYEKLSISVIQTAVIDLGEIKKTINKDVVIIKKSIPIKSKRNGLLTKFYNQGDRVSKNAVVFKVQDTNSSENDVSKLERINLQIDQMQNNSSYSPELQSMQVDSEINYIYLDIQKRINNNDLSYLAKLKSELSARNEKKKSIILSVRKIGEIEEKKELEKLFPEFLKFIPNCKFRDCIHVNEPNCAIKENVKNGNISQERYAFYLYSLENIKFSNSK